MLRSDKKEEKTNIKSSLIEASLMAMRQKNSGNSFIDAASEPFFGKTQSQVMKHFASPVRLLGDGFERLPSMVLISDDKDFKATRPRVGQLLITPLENGYLTCKLIILSGAIVEVVITEEELKAGLDSSYKKFSDALKQKYLNFLKRFQPKILELISGKGYELTETMPLIKKKIDIDDFSALDGRGIALGIRHQVEKREQMAKDKDKQR